LTAKTAKTSKFTEMTSLDASRFSYGTFLEFVGVKDKTLRTWLKKFPEVGERQANGKMLFSALECVTLHTFAALVTRLSMRPESAAKIAKAQRNYMKEQPPIEYYKASDPLFIVVSDISSDTPDYEILDHKGIKRIFATVGFSPFTVIPIDMGFLALHVMIMDMQDSTSRSYADLLKAVGEGKEVDAEWLEKVKANFEIGEKVLGAFHLIKDTPRSKIHISKSMADREDKK